MRVIDPLCPPILVDAALISGSTLTSASAFYDPGACGIVFMDNQVKSSRNGLCHYFSEKAVSESEVLQE